jgi:hypothetical protein
VASDATLAILERCQEMALQQYCDSESVEAWARYHNIPLPIAYQIVALGNSWKDHRKSGD